MPENKGRRLNVTVMSFGFKNGLPREADIDRFQRYGASTVRSCKIDLSAEGEKGRRQIAAGTEEGHEALGGVPVPLLANRLVIGGETGLPRSGPRSPG